MESSKRIGQYLRVLAGVLFLLLSINGQLFPQEMEAASLNLVESLHSTDPKTRNNSVDGVLEDRSLIIKQLISLVDPVNVDKYSDDTRSAAAYLLGELRSPEAVAVLSMSLQNPPGIGESSDTSRDDFPIFNALVKIGRPAVPAMIENIEKTDNLRLRTKSLDVLYHVLGGKRRLLEVLVKVEERALNKQIPERAVARRVKEAHDWADSHYKYTRGTKEPLF